MSIKAGQKRRFRPKWGPLALVILFHLAVLAGLVRAFAPNITSVAVEKAISVLTVSITVPEPEPTMEPVPEPQPDEGAAAEQGRKAKPRATTAPKPRIIIKPAPPAPRVSSEGDDTNSGASEAGEGTGGGGAGDGTGSGLSGSGQGNGIRKLKKLAGNINSARDYPRDTRKLRIGQSVTILLTVGADGRVKRCQITASSPDAQADQITCQLATDRFRFRPAADSRGNPITGKYAWRQKWFY